jgi:hypothetical protein
MRKTSTATLRPSLTSAAIALLFVAAAATIIPSAPAPSATTQTNMQAPQAVATAVIAAQNQDPLPATITPTPSLAITDQTQLGVCSAYQQTPQRKAVTSSTLCNLGDPHGTKTLVAFGNSHTVMWTQGLITVAQTNHWKFYPVVKQACGYDTYVGLMAGPVNQCELFYKWALGAIKQLHPNAIIIGSYTKTPYWRAGESTIIRELRRLTPRLILFSDTPHMAPPGSCLETATTQDSCLWPLDPARIIDELTTQTIASSLNVQYLDITNWFCDQGLCPSIINGIIPYTDGAHVTPEYAQFLAPDLSAALNLNATPPTITPITSVPLPPLSSTTTTPSAP